jgi:Nuclease-related domain
MPAPPPWPAPTASDLVLTDPVPPAESPPDPSVPTVAPAARRPVAVLLGTAKRLSSRSERAEHAAAKEEQRICAELDDLPAGWFVLHSIEIDKDPDTRHVDHIAIGPAGIFTIFLEHQSGAKVWISEHALTINGRDSDQLRKARSEARLASGHLSTACGFDVTVQSVLVLIGAATMQMLSRPPEVHVRTQYDIRDWLCRQPPRLDAEQVRAIYEQLRPVAMPPSESALSLVE